MCVRGPHAPWNVPTERGGEEGFWGWVGFCAVSSLSDGKNTLYHGGLWLCKFLFIFSFFFVCLGFTQASGSLLPRLRFRHLSHHKLLWCGTQLLWSIPVSLLPKRYMYMSVSLHTSLWLSPFQVLCSVWVHPLHCWEAGSSWRRASLSWL